MLPSKKILVPVSLALAFGIIFWSYHATRGGSVKSASNQQAGGIVALDSDQQNLFALQGTSSDAWKKILGSSGSASPLNTPQNTSSQAPENLTPTDTFARDLFAKYLAVQQQAGKPLTSDQQQAFVNNYLNSANLPTISGKQYTAGDLQVSNTTSLTDYTKNMANLVNQYWQLSKTTNELTILSDASNNQDVNLLAKLDPYIQSYKQFIVSLLITPVPTSAVVPHLNVVNSMSNYIAALTAIRASGNDPVSALSAFNLYSNAEETFVQSFVNLKTFLAHSS